LQHELKLIQELANKKRTIPYLFTNKSKHLVSESYKNNKKLKYNPAGSRIFEDRS
jgi:hypothetical protein